MQALQQVALQAGKMCGSDTLATINRRNLFNPATMKSQPDSLLMALPTELRVMIYEAVFSAPATGTEPPLALLSTCRQIHGEAIEIALKTCQFYGSPGLGFAFESRLSSLGPLQQHLRHVKVEIPIDDLTYHRATNPFALIELPLDKLEIKIDIPEFLTWTAASRIYGSIMSAVLYQDAYATATGATMRRVALTLRTYWATRKPLRSMLRSTRAKRVVVTCRSYGDDVFFAAFSHFKLVDGDMGVLSRREGDQWPEGTHQKRYLMLASGDGMDILEFGQGVPKYFEAEAGDIGK